MRLSLYLPAFVVALGAIYGWADFAAAQDVYPVSANMYDDAEMQPQAQDDGGQSGCQGGSCDNEGVFAGICDPGDDGPRWIIAAEAMFLHRVNSGRQTLFEGFNANELLNARDFRFPLEIGPKLSAIRRGPCGWGVEVAYFQFDGFRDDLFVPGTSDMLYDGINGSSFSVEDATASYTSALYSGEVNLRREYCDWLTLLVGFRMVELNERYLAIGADATSGFDDSVGVNVFNHLYGLQIGADGEIFNRCGPLRINAICKAGIFGNTADMNIRRVADSAIEDVLTSRKTHAAFIGEAGVSMTYALTCHLAFRASYSAMFVQGVALAPEQIGAADYRTMEAIADVKGDIFYHGGGMGLEFRY